MRQFNESSSLLSSVEKAKTAGGDKYYQQLSIEEIDSSFRKGEEDPEETMYQKSRFFTLRTMCLIFGLAAVPFLMILKDGTKPEGPHDHTIPTLLGVRFEVPTPLKTKTEKKKYKYVNALSNDVYETMKNANFQKGPPNSDSISFSLETDRNEISPHEQLKISWYNEKNQKGNDDENIIALYCPSTETNPKKFRDAATLNQIKLTTRLEQENATTTTTTSYLSDRNEWYIPSFPIVKENDCEFRLWIKDSSNRTSTTKTDTTSFRLGAKTGSIKIKNGTILPHTIHLALTSQQDEMLVHFSTGFSKGIPVVAFGTEKNVVENESGDERPLVENGTSTTYTADDMCQEPANIEEPGKFVDPGLLHSVTMKKLDFDTKYYYKVGLVVQGQKADDIVWSDIHSFHSSIPSSGQSIHPSGKSISQKPFSFLVYADQGCPGYGWKDGGDRTAKWAKREITENNIRSVHHFGDLSYAQGSGHLWDQWLDMISIFSASVPLMIGIGNHEYDHTSGGNNKDPSGLLSKDGGGYHPEWGNFANDSNGECGVPAAKRFLMPDNGNGIFWYSFNNGLVHTVMLSSEHDLSPGSEQYQWLKSDLQSINREDLPWVIVESHRPMYNSEDVPKNTKVGIAMRNQIEELLHQYNVDLFLAGHYHAYLRTCAGLYKGKCDNGGLTHITIGTAGATIDNVGLFRQKWTSDFRQEWGYGRITIVNETALHWEFVTNENGNVKDETWIMK